MKGPRWPFLFILSHIWLRLSVPIPSIDRSPFLFLNLLLFLFLFRLHESFSNGSCGFAEERLGGEMQE
jgi:hypothetical protein